MNTDWMAMFTRWAPQYVVPSIALLVSLIALAIAWRTYRRKAGLLVRGSFTICSSVECDDKYVSAVVLENLKDRAITIFAIYLRLGPNYYIRLEDFDGKPLVLRAYETYRAEYGPVQLYGVNMKRINLEALFDDRRVRKRLVLSTSSGKYVVPKSIRAWNPYGDFFRNHLTGIVTPVRALLGETAVGGNTLYVVTLTSQDGKEELAKIFADDFRGKKFRNFLLTKECLASAKSLEDFLGEQRQLGKLWCKEFKVHDVRAWRAKILDDYKHGNIVGRRYGVVTYLLLGRLGTMYADWRLRRENLLLQQRNIAIAREKAMQAKPSETTANETRVPGVPNDQ